MTRLVSASFVLLLAVLFSAGAAFGQQEIYDLEGVNMPGSWNTWTNPPTTPVSIGGIQTAGGTVLPDSGLATIRYSTLIYVNTTGADFVGGNYDFLFTSGPTTNYWANAWKDVTVVMDSMQTYNYYTSGGTNNNVTLTDGKYYSVRFRDVEPYGNTPGVWMVTSAAPVNLTGVSQAPVAGLVNVTSNVVVTVTLSAAKSAEEIIYVRYTTDNWATSTLLTASGAGTSYTATIPAQTAGTNVAYYAFSSTKADPSFNYDMYTLKYNNNNKTNYGYTVHGPLAGLYAIPGAYPTGFATIKSAVDSLNAFGVGTGGVTFNVASGHTEATAPIILTATGTGTDPIVFQESGTGANPLITPGAVGTLVATNFRDNGDGIFKIHGGDNITFNAIDLSDVAFVDSIKAYEYGYYFLKSATNASKNCTILNCKVTLSRLTRNSAAIYVSNRDIVGGTTVTVTSTGGRSENIQIYADTLTNTQNGVSVDGFADGTAPYALYDQNIWIGDGGGNVITNFGSTVATAHGIVTRYANDVRMNNNYLRSTGSATTIRGIYSSTANNANIDVIGNDVSISSSSATGGNELDPIATQAGSTGNTSNTIRLMNNYVHNCLYPTATSGGFRGLENTGTPLNLIVTGNTLDSNIVGGSSGSFYCLNLGAPTNLTVKKNVVSRNMKLTTATGSFDGILAGSVVTSTVVDSNDVYGNIQGGTSAMQLINAGSAPTVKMRWNNVYNNKRTGASNIMYCLRASNGDVTAAFNNVYNDSIPATSGTSSASLYGYYNSSTSGSKDSVYGNTFSNLVIGGATSSTSTLVRAIHSDPATASTKAIFDNTISGLKSHIGDVRGIHTASSATAYIFRNNIYNLECGAAGGVATGIYVVSGTTNHVYNNFISDLRAPAATGTVTSVCGLYIGGGTNSNNYYNTIYLNTTNGGTTFGSSALYASTSPTVDLRNNIVVNLSTPGATGGWTAAYRRSGTTLTTYASTSNNNDFYVNPGAGVRRYHYSQGLTPVDCDSTIAAFKSRVGPTRDANSFAENPPFKNVAATPYNLHMDSTIATQTESGGSPVTAPIAVADDYDLQARNGSTPDVGADEFSGVGLDLTPPAIVYTPLVNTHLLTDRTLAVAISDAGGVQRSLVGQPRIYYKKGIAGAYVSPPDSAVEAPTGTFTFTIRAASLPGLATGDTVFYYVAAQDSNNNAGTNPSGGSGINPPGSTPPPTVNSYRIVGTIAGAVTIGATPGPEGTPPGTFANIKAFFDSVNASIVTGNITASIISNIAETATATLNAVNYDAFGPYSILIQPSGGSWADTGSIAGALIDLNGADYVKFDGLAHTLTFRNINTGGQTFLFRNDAVQDTLHQLVIEGTNNSTSSGTVVFGTSTGSTGNDNILVIDNKIRDLSTATGVPVNAVYSAGTSGALNSDNVVQDNEIYNWTGYGVYVTSTGNGDSWNVQFNALYQTASRAGSLVGVSIQAGSGHNVWGNDIGGSGVGRVGAPLTNTTGYFYGISLGVGTGSATLVSGNVISNIDNGGSSTSYMIYVSSGNVQVGGPLTGNTIGGGAVASDTIRVNYDTYGIYSTSSGTVTIRNNTIGNVRSTSTGADYLNGIRATAGTVTISNNTVRDLSTWATSTTQGSLLTGIYLSASTTSGQSVQGNTIYNLSSLAAGTSAYPVSGIYIASVTSSPNVTEVGKNKIYGLSVAGTGTGTASPTVHGIYISSGRATYVNNMITVGAGAGLESRVWGIQSAASTRNYFYYNSVYVGGATAAGSNNSYAFNRSSSDTVALVNNILVNARTTGGTGYNYAIGNTHTSGAGWLAAASNYNVLNATSPSAVGLWTSAGSPVGFAGWKTASAGDANSQSGVTVTFANTGTGDLHLNMGTNPTSLESGGTAVAGYATDYDSDVRPGPLGSVNGGATAPDFGADEFDGVPAPLMAYVSNTATQGNTTVVFKNSTNNQVIGIEVVTTGSTNPLLATEFYLNTNGTSAPLTDITNAKLFYTGTSPTFSAINPFGATVAAPSGQFNFTGTGQALSEGTNYFWLTYDIPSGAVTTNVVDAELESLKVDGVMRYPATGAPAGNRAIAGPLAGAYNVGASQTYPFNTLTNAVYAAKTAGITSWVTFNLIDAAYTTPAETFPIVVDSIPGATAGSRLTIKPAPATTVTISGSSASSILKLNNTDYVTIDGSNAGGSGRDMTIANTSTSTLTAAVWIASQGAGLGCN
ncbi:MAG: BNR-repeat neuraminidase N-terminal domain-containing protein, partial [Bacteroidota bacterium]